MRTALTSTASRCTWRFAQNLLRLAKNFLKCRKRSGLEGLGTPSPILRANRRKGDLIRSCYRILICPARGAVGLRGASLRVVVERVFALRRLRGVARGLVCETALRPSLPFPKLAELSGTVKYLIADVLPINPGETRSTGLTFRRLFIPRNATGLGAGLRRVSEVSNATSSSDPAIIHSILPAQGLATTLAVLGAAVPSPAAAI
jgi:hypothetical protein